MVVNSGVCREDVVSDDHISEMYINISNNIRLVLLTLSTFPIV